uniref:Uncharacterized protein n=1 Tax=Anguilla anguilla TaxID=7936 RepID=A0A0E9PXL9_ANGAN
MERALIKFPLGPVLTATWFIYFMFHYLFVQHTPSSLFCLQSCIFKILERI